MTQFLISFPGEVMVFPEEDFAAVVEVSHAVIDEAKAAVPIRPGQLMRATSVRAQCVIRP